MPISTAESGPDKARRRGDRHQPGNRAGGGAQHGGLAGVAPLGKHPAQRRRCRRGVGGDERKRRRFVGAQGTAGVEAEPPHPQQGSANNGKRQVVRRHVLTRKAAALAQHDGADQRGDAGADVNHGAAGKIQRSHGTDPAAAPYPVGQRVVNQGAPQQAEDQEGGKLHALGKGAGDERRGDGREHALKRHEGEVRNGVGVRAGLAPYPRQAEVVQVADHAADIRAKGKAVSPQHPLHADHGQQNETLHQGGQHVLAAHQAAVEQRQARRHHHQDEHRRGQHPGGVAGAAYGSGRLFLRLRQTRRHTQQKAKTRPYLGQNLHPDFADQPCEH